MGVPGTACRQTTPDMTNNPYLHSGEKKDDLSVCRQVFSSIRNHRTSNESLDVGRTSKRDLSGIDREKQT